MYDISASLRQYVTLLSRRQTDTLCVVRKTDAAASIVWRKNKGTQQNEHVVASLFTIPYYVHSLQQYYSISSNFKQKLNTLKGRAWCIIQKALCYSPYVSSYHFCCCLRRLYQIMPYAATSSPISIAKRPPCSCI